VWAAKTHSRLQLKDLASSPVSQRNVRLYLVENNNVVVEGKVHVGQTTVIWRGH
jgi:hypothetical protein